MTFIWPLWEGILQAYSFVSFLTWAPRSGGAAQHPYFPWVEPPASHDARQQRRFATARRSQQSVAAKCECERQEMIIQHELYAPSYAPQLASGRGVVLMWLVGRPHGGVVSKARGSLIIAAKLQHSVRNSHRILLINGTTRGAVSQESLAISIPVKTFTSRTLCRWK